MGVNMDISKFQLVALITQVITFIITFILLIITIILLVITWRYLDSTKEMATMMRTEYKMKLDSVIYTEHSTTLPAYPIRQESFWIANSYIAPVKLLDYEFHWWHRDYPEKKFTIKKKDINVTINPTVSIEEVLELNMEQLKKYNLEKKDIDGKIDYQMILRFKVNSTIITKEIIRIPTERLKKEEPEK
jgi:hypothetical protein